MSSPSHTPAAAGCPIQPRTEDAEEVPVREERDDASGRDRALEHTVGARRHLVGGLPARSSVAKDRPSRDLSADLIGGAPLVLAVVPLGEVVRDIRFGLAAREHARHPRPLARAREHEREVDALEALAIARAWSQLGVRAMSEYDVCRPELLHSVSP